MPNNFFSNGSEDNFFGPFCPATESLTSDLSGPRPMYGGGIYLVFCTTKLGEIVTSTYWSIMPSGVGRNVVLSTYDVIFGNWSVSECKKGPASSTSLKTGGSIRGQENFFNRGA